jgi:hypothetical protein
VRGAHPRQRGTFVEAWTRGGCTKERGRTCPRTSPNITKFLQGGCIYKWAKEKASQGKGKAQGKEAKGLAREEGCLCSWDSRHIYKGLQSIQVWLLMYQVHLYLFSLLYSCFEISKYIHLSLNWFSSGGFIQGHVDQK